MTMLQIVAEAIGFAFASLLAAVLFNWCCWRLIKLSHLPEWGPPIGLIVLLAVFGGRIAGNEFFYRTVGLAILVSVIMWAMRRNLGRRFTVEPVADSLAKRFSPISHASGERSIYPAIVACIGEGRTPSRAEIDKVAKRIRRETFPDQPLSPSLHRTVTRAALAALGVPQSAGRSRRQDLDHDRLV